MTTEFLANIRVVLKSTVSDPQGATIMAGLKTLGFESIKDLRAGKFLQVRISAEDSNSAEKQITEMCGKLLANPVIENYDFDIQTVDN